MDLKTILLEILTKLESGAGFDPTTVPDYDPEAVQTLININGELHWVSNIATVTQEDDEVILE